VTITPHPGEAARLLGTTPAAVQADRFAAARRLTAETGAVTVLKGAGTIVASGDAPLSVNLTGNPGMATGGTGDVLAGLITGLSAQGLPPAEAARLGVYAHGLAGDLAAWRGCPMSLIAGDLVENLPRTFRELRSRAAC
jgi:NAD(P)H-hydrate epimerase